MVNEGNASLFRVQLDNKVLGNLEVNFLTLTTVPVRLALSRLSHWGISLLVPSRSTLNCSFSALFSHMLITSPALTI